MANAEPPGPQDPDSPQPPERGRRRAKGKERRRRLPWIPGTGKKPDSFLPKLPEHSHTGVIYRPGADRDRLIRQGIDPDRAPKRRKKRLVSRTIFAFLIRWRYFVSVSLGLSLLLSFLGSVVVVSRDAGNNSGRLPVQGAPTLDELNRSILLGQRYLNALYKPLPNGEAVQSEASGVPLRAYFPNEKKWVLFGEDQRDCTDGCQNTTLLDLKKDEQNSTTYTVAFSTPANRGALSATVVVNWAYQPSVFQVEVTPTTVKEPVDLWIDRVKFGSFTPGARTKLAQTYLSSNQSLLRMLRFTIRHATQEAYLYWSSYGRDKTKAAALKKFLERNGYTAGFDLRAPLFNAGTTLPDDMPVDDKAYPDCEHIAASSEFAYAYRSRVCLFETAYIGSGERDPFLQAWAALTILMKYNDPNREQPEWGWWTQGDTPTEVAEHLQGQWNRTGWGVPKCTPFSCAEMSGIRTSVFGALEAQLGYVHGDADAKKFADAAAKVITQAQVGADGQIRLDDGHSYYRPGQAGSFLSAWTAPKLEFTQPSTPQLPVAIALLVRRSTPTPLEFDGIIPSNSETSFDALGFLMMYRCLAYRVGCLN